MTRHRLYLSLFYLLPLLYFLSLPITVSDLAIWVAHGRYLLEHGTILRHDVFSVLPTRALIYPVGSAFIYGILYGAVGLTGLSVLHKLVPLGISALWYRSTLERMTVPWSSASLALILLSWVGASFAWIDRPSLLAMVPFVLGFLILQKEEPLDLGDLVLLNVINVVWVNLHGSWLLLTAMLGWRVGMRSWLGFLSERKVVVAWSEVVGLGALCATSLLNPFGASVFDYVFVTARISVARHIEEWTPTWRSGFRVQRFAFLFLNVLYAGLLAAWLRAGNRKARALLASPFTFLMILGWQAIRNTIWPFFVLIPAAGHLGCLPEGPAPAETPTLARLCNGALVASVVVAIVVFLPWVKPRFADILPPAKSMVYDETAPFRIAQYLSRTPDRAALFSDWTYGSFLALAQPHPIFMDARNIIYADPEFRDYSRVMEAQPGWPRVLDHYRIHYVIVSPALSSKLVAGLEASGWRRVMRDGVTGLWARDRRVSAGVAVDRKPNPVAATLPPPRGSDDEDPTAATSSGPRLTPTTRVPTACRNRKCSPRARVSRARP